MGFTGRGGLCAASYEGELEGDVLDGLTHLLKDNAGVHRVAVEGNGGGNSSSNHSDGAAECNSESGNPGNGGLANADGVNPFKPRRNWFNYRVPQAS